MQHIRVKREKDSYLSCRIRLCFTKRMHTFFKKVSITYRRGRHVFRERVRPFPEEDQKEFFFTPFILQKAFENDQKRTYSFTPTHPFFRHKGRYLPLYPFISKPEKPFHIHFDISRLLMEELYEFLPDIGPEKHRDV